MMNLRLIFAAMLFLLFFAACKKDASEGQSEAQKASAQVSSHQYDLRGQVTFLPAKAGGEIEIHHEEIPDFINKKGEKTGMMSMVMPFALGTGVSVEGLAVGSKIAFTLDVDWTRDAVLEIRTIKKLSDDTKLKI